jgi:hypothetical protein
MHIIITTIYSLQEPNLNHRNYSEQELNMDNFVQANEYDVHMYTKFQDVCKYRYFYTNLTLFCLFSIYIIYYYETILISQGYGSPKIMDIFMNLRNIIRGNISKI